MRIAPLGLALMATGMALGTNLLLYALARLAGVPFQVAPPGRPPEEVGLAAVALFTALPMALGFALYVPFRLGAEAPGPCPSSWAWPWPPSS